MQKKSLLISIISCNRLEYLNKSLFYITNHINKYENNLYISFISIDQGTLNREIIFEKYKVSNNFFLNPKGYAYSFSILFSYLYMKYVLILEEDWLIVDNVVKNLIFSNFLYTSLNLLSDANNIYGLYLRQHIKGKSIKKINKKLNITYFEVIQPFSHACYTNGASIYKTKNLIIMDYGVNETMTQRKCTELKFHIGFIYWKFKNDKYTDYIFRHIGYKSTGNGLCRIAQY